MISGFSQLLMGTHSVKPVTSVRDLNEHAHNLSSYVKCFRCDCFINERANDKVTKLKVVSVNMVQTITDAKYILTVNFSNYLDAYKHGPCAAVECFIRP